MTTTIILVSVAVVLLLWCITTYNGLIVFRNRYKNAFAQIDVQLKRRYDLIPNLVETAKGYMAHEKSTLEAVIQARNGASAANQRVAQNPSDPDAMMSLNRAEGQLSGAMRGFNIQVEAYPDLKANVNMLRLQEELTSTENKISFARQAFNDSVTAYNTRREQFPTNVIAGVFGFQSATLFEVENPSEREAVKVAF